MCIANQENMDAEKMSLFPCTLKKKEIEWYLQFAPTHFANWDELRQAFFHRFRPNKMERELIDGLQNEKQKKHETVEELYKRIMIAVNKLRPVPRDELKKTWFQNGLHKDYATYIELLPNDTLEDAFLSARKVELGLSRKERLKIIKRR